MVLLTGKYIVLDFACNLSGFMQEIGINKVFLHEDLYLLLIKELEFSQNMNKKIIILTLLLVFAFFRVQPSEITLDRVKQAKLLIENGDYRSAMEILSSELKNNHENREEILHLVRLIEEKKIFIINSANKIMNLYSKNEFAEADKLRKSVKLDGNFDDETNLIIERIKSLQVVISKRVGFVDYINAAEKNITEYRLKDAVGNIDAAIKIYEMTDDNNLKSIFDAKFDDYKMENLFLYPDIAINSTSDIETEFNKLGDYRRRFLKLESDMMEVFRVFDELLVKEDNPTKRLVYSAYRTAADKSAETAIRVGQLVYRMFSNSLFDYCDKIIIDNKPDLESDLEFAYSFIKKNSFERFAFYKNKINFNDMRYLKRSQNNIYDYLVYAAKKDKLYYKINELGLNKKIDEAASILIAHKENLDNGDLIAAGNTLKKLTALNQSIQNEKYQFEKSIDNSFFDSPYLKSDKTVYDSVVNSVTKLNTQITDESAGLENTKIRISNLLVDAQKKDKEAVLSQKSGDYDRAKELYEAAKTGYYEVTALTRSKEIDLRVEEIVREMKNIESEIFRRDIESADKLVLQARTFLYNEDYKSASERIRKAQELYRKNNQANEYASKLEQRIETAIKMRREVTLNYDDGAYKNIVEWYDNAIKSLNNKDYVRAELFKDKILSEKPFYEKARQLEIKILLAKGDMAFFKSRFNEYFNESLKFFNEGNYTAALNGFKQLLEYNYDTKRINEYIYSCNVKLGFISKPVTVDERGNAVALVERAKRYYESGDFENALKLSEQAINLWEDVPNVSSIRIGSMRRLHKPLPGMSADNERKYALAARAYSEENYKEVIRLTDEILKTEKSEKVVQLNSNAKKLLVIKERGL